MPAIICEQGLIDLLPRTIYPARRRSANALGVFSRAIARPEHQELTRLGTIDKYDVNDKNFVKQIKSDKMNLKKIFVFSKDYDMISNEYATGFNIILNEGLPYFLSIFNRTKDINIATVNTFLKTLAEHPDTLIIRKSGKDAAQYLSDKAVQIVEKGGITTREGFRLAIDLDKELRERTEKMNPGTTADLLAGIIFCALLFGLRF